MEIKQYKNPEYSHALCELSAWNIDNTFEAMTICVINRVNILITNSDILTGLKSRLNKYAENMYKISISTPVIIYPNNTVIKIDT